MYRRPAHWREERSVAAESEASLTGCAGELASVIAARPPCARSRSWQAPGTGKTTTVARIVALLPTATAAGARPPLVALAAPTGKAAARLQEAVHDEAAPMRSGARALLALRRDAAPAARLAAGEPQPVSPTTAATACRTTS